MVQVSEDPDRRLWSLWAAKEAAFKAVHRRDSSIVFSPIRFTIEPETSVGRALVAYGNLSLSVAWSQGPDWVHAVVWQGTLPPLGIVERQTDGPESEAVRALAVREMQRMGYGPGLVVERPPVYRDRDGRDHLVSLSHDGPYSAVAFFAPTLP